jgi:hypothetical protein
LVDEPSAATPHDTSADGRYLLFTDFGSSLVSGFTSLHRLDTLTLERERMDVRSIPLQFPPFGQGVRDAAISDAGEYVVFSTDDDHILPGDTNWVREPYMRVPSHSASLRAGLNPAGQEADDATEGVDMTGDGALIAFDSRATNLLASDTNGFADVFVRSVCADAYPDADGDAYGDASATPQLVCLPITGSLVLKAGDCDDGDPAIHPGVAEICDGVDQDCDSVIDEVGSSASFCQTSITTNGCTPDLFTTGCASVSAGSGFSLVLDQVEGQRSGLFFYAEWEYFWPTPWTPGSSSYICVGVPRQRTAMLQSAGTAGACDGQLALDFLTWSAAHPTALGMPLHAGQSLYFQAWFRDPPAPKGTNLSNGWRAVLAP